MTSNEKQHLLERWTDTALEHDRARCVHELLERTAQETPDAVAVTAVNLP